MRPAIPEAGRYRRDSGPGQRRDMVLILTGAITPHELLILINLRLNLGKLRLPSLVKLGSRDGGMERLEPSAVARGENWLAGLRQCGFGAALRPS